MDKTGFYYYFDKNGLDISRLNFYWDFYIPDNSSAVSGLNGFTGVGTGDFWGYSSKGNFNSECYITPNSGLVDTDSYTLNLTFNKQITGLQVLFSTQSGASGYTFGVSDSNKLFCSAFDNADNSYTTKVFNFNLAEKNSVYLIKNGNSVSVGKFNYTDKYFENDFFNFPGSCNLESDKIIIGSGDTSFINNKNSNFLGTLDYIFSYNEALDDNILNDLQKSFYKNNPTEGYGLLSETDTYSFSRSNNPNLRLPSFEENTSGVLDYIRSNLFNITGLGTIKFDLTGTENVSDSQFTDFSGRIYGTLTTVSGYYEIVTTSGVTGFSSSGQTPISGVTGYQNIELPSIPVWHSGAGYTGKIYRVFAESGVSGVTGYEDVFTDPIYQVVSGSGFTNGIISTVYNIAIPPFTSISNSPNNSANYVLKSSYTNDGKDRIIINHRLNYEINGEQLYTIKKTLLNYGTTIVDGSDDSSYLSGFYMNGVCFLEPLESGSVLELLIYTGNSIQNFQPNTIPEFNSLSGYFFENSGAFENFDNILVINGVSYLPSGIGYSGQFGFYKTEDKYNRADLALVSKSLSGAYPSLISYVSSLNSGTELVSKNNVFFNGIKLISGYHYTGSKISTNFFSGSSGFIYSLVDNNQFYKAIISEERHNYNFPERYSILFKNGVRQYLDDDYVEFSNLDAISGLSNIPNITNSQEIINL
jgi:hypothetical protein